MKEPQANRPNDMYFNSNEKFSQRPKLIHRCLIVRCTSPSEVLPNTMPQFYIMADIDNDRPYRRRTTVVTKKNLRRQTESTTEHYNDAAVVDVGAGTAVLSVTSTITSRKRHHPESSSISSSLVSTLPEPPPPMPQPPLPLPLPPIPLPPPQMSSPFIIPFVVPTTIPIGWLMEKVPIILIHHILYSRGLLPIPVHELFQLPLPAPAASSSHHYTDNTSSSTTEMLTTTLPSGFVGGSATTTTRRKVRQSQEQIQKLSTTYDAVLSTILSIIGSDSYSCSCSSPSHPNFTTNRLSHPLPLLRYLLITIGTTFSQSKELYVIDLQTLSSCLHGDDDDDDGDTGTSLDENNNSNNNSSYHHHQQQHNDPNRMSRMEITLRRKLISKFVSVEFGRKNVSCSDSKSTANYEQKDSSSHPTENSQQDVPIHQTLPYRSAPSFRLWLTLGLERNSNSDEESKFIEYLVNQHNLILRPNGIPKIRQNPRHTTIRRRRRQQQQQQQKFGVTPQNHQTTINETVVVQLQQQQQHQKRRQDLVSCCSTSSSRRPSENLATLNLNDPNITWLSVPTGVKGFRL